VNSLTPAQSKLLATLIAEFALRRGYQVHELANGGYLLCGPGCGPRHLPSLEHLRGAARQMLGFVE
jgi:hypothetical protein